jgi:hypothetical protein
MSENRLCKKVLLWSCNLASNNKKNWVFHVRQMLSKLDLNYVNVDILQLNISDVLHNIDSKLNDLYEGEWLSDVMRENARTGNGRNKLRTYRLFKTVFKTESYVKSKYMSRGLRSCLAKFRCGVAPLRIETGRYERNRLPVNERLCVWCQTDIEDEKHVLLKCKCYDDLRTVLFSQVQSLFIYFNVLPDDDKFILLMSEPTIEMFVARTLQSCLQRRQILLTQSI